MVTVTELNRAPNITVNAIDAASVSADKLNSGDISDTQAANLVPVTDGNGGLQIISVPNAALSNDSVTVAGNSVALGGSTTPEVTGFSVGTLADGEFLQNSGGSLAGGAVPGAFSNIEVFESDGTFNASNTDFASVEVVGGGGGGGYGNNNESSGGGGGGGYGSGLVDISNESSISITVGGGGAGGSSSGDDGSAGGSSSFGSFISATGGSGGLSSSPYDGGSGGVGSGGDINSTGAPGGAGGGNQNVHGLGGSSLYGGGAAPTTGYSSGADGNKYGGGGAGAGNSKPGGSGSDGIVIVRY